MFLEDILALQRRKWAWLHFYVPSVLSLQGLEDGCWWTSFTAYPWINHVCLKPGHQRKPRKTVLKSSVFDYLSFYSSLSRAAFPGIRQKHSHLTDFAWAILQETCYIQKSSWFSPSLPLGLHSNVSSGPKEQMGSFRHLTPVHIPAFPGVRATPGSPQQAPPALAQLEWGWQRRLLCLR